MASDHVEVLGGEVRRSEAAILWHVEAADEEVWFPLSQVKVSSDGTSLLVPKWLASKKGI